MRTVRQDIVSIVAGTKREETLSQPTQASLMRYPSGKLESGLVFLPRVIPQKNTYKAS